VNVQVDGALEDPGEAGVRHPCISVTPWAQNKSHVCVLPEYARA
jgi:hypothetical protein